MASTSRKKSTKLLDSSESESEETKGFQVNNDYAKRYEKWRGNEEMQKLKDRYGENPDEAIESSDESTSEEEWTTEHEISFLTALSSLKGKDPRIYDGSKTFFTNTEVKDSDSGTKVKVKKAKDKPYLVKDHERKMILEKSLDEDSDEEEDKPRPPSYYEQQDQIKKDLEHALRGFETAGDGDDNSDLLKKRVKTEIELEQEEEDYRRWLKGELKKLDGNDKEEQLKFLRDYWNDPKLDDGEQFLRDYVLQRKYLEEDENKGYIPTYDEIIHDSDAGGLSEDEKQIEEMENFENKFRFRFEEPDQEFIKKYPRTIMESYRRKETKRKDERAKAKERRQEEKDKKVAEIQQLKALKRKEILEKIEKLQKITGDADLPFGDIDLEGDFDPAEHDRKMNAIFNQEYYTEADEAKPVFAYDEEIDGDQEDLEPWVPSDEDEIENEHDADAESEEPSVNGKQRKRKKPKVDEKAATKEKSKKTIKSELLEISKGKRMGKKKSMFLEALEKEKPKFDPSVHKSFEKYFDEYNKLDFEDLVGDLPCRFKYRSVVPNDFGLTTEEVLKANDAELNQWASLKKTYQYRTQDEEKYEVQAYSKKSQNLNKKKQLLASVYSKRSSDEEEEDAKDVDIIVKAEVPAGVSQPEQKKRKKKKKKKKASDVTVIDVTQRQSVVSSETPIVKQEPKSNTPSKAKQPAEESTNSTAPAGQPGLSKRKKKNRKRRKSSITLNHINGTDTVQAQTQTTNAAAAKRHPPQKKAKVDTSQKRQFTPAAISEDRLRAYGINPTKYEKRRKYAK